MARPTNKELQEQVRLLTREVEILKQQNEIGEDQFRRLRDEHHELLKHRDIALADVAKLLRERNVLDGQMEDLERERNKWRNAAADKDSLQYIINDLRTTVRVLATQLALESGEVTEV